MAKLITGKKYGQYFELHLTFSQGGHPSPYPSPQPGRGQGEGTEISQVFLIIEKLLGRPTL
jgi:hypothetical protein